MKKIVFILLAITFVCLFGAGCSESGEKVGGGGKMQRYDKETGRYN